MCCQTHALGSRLSTCEEEQRLTFDAVRIGEALSAVVSMWVSRFQMALEEFWQYVIA